MASDFNRSAAPSSRIRKKSTPAALRRTASSPFNALRRQRPVQRSKSKADVPEDEDDLFNDRLDDIGLVQALATDLTLRDVAQAIQYIGSRMFSPVPNERSGMSSTRISEVLNFRASIPPIVTVPHVQALLNSPTAVEREIAELIQGGAVRKLVIGGRGTTGEVLILVKDLERMVEKTTMDEEVKQHFVALLRQNPTASRLPQSSLSAENAKALMQAGFITSSTPAWTSTDVFSRPGEGMKGTMTSLDSISKAASGSVAAVGGEGIVHAAGGSGGGVRLLGKGDFSLALPTTGGFLKLLTNARSHLLFLLSKSKYTEVPESLLKQRWDGGIAGDDPAAESKRARGEFSVLPGRTRKWKQLYGIRFEWVLEECVGAGQLEVFNTGSIGRGVRAL